MNPGRVRASLVVLLLVLIGWGAWRSVPSPRTAFDPGQLARNRQLLAAKFWIQPDTFSGPVSFEAATVRLPPGSGMNFGRARLDGLLHGRFQTADPAGAIMELAAVNRNGWRRVILRSKLAPAASAAHILILDPGALPPDIQSLRLDTAADSPAAIDWSDVETRSRQDDPLLHALPLPLIAYEGFVDPIAKGPAILTHAPAEFVLAVPPGSRHLEAAFGFNPDVFIQPGNDSDGMLFQILLESPLGTQAQELFSRAFSPRVNPADRELQHAGISLNPTGPAQLRLVTDPGAQGNNSWDWAVWQDFKTAPEARP